MEQVQSRPRKAKSLAAIVSFTYWTRLARDLARSLGLIFTEYRVQSLGNCIVWAESLSPTLPACLSRPGPALRYRPFTSRSGRHRGCSRNHSGYDLKPSTSLLRYRVLQLLTLVPDRYLVRACGIRVWKKTFQANAVPRQILGLDPPRNSCCLMSLLFRPFRILSGGSFRGNLL